MSWTTSTENSNQAIVRRFVTAIEAGDTVTLKDLVAESATWTLHGSLPVAGYYIGRQAILDDFLAQGLGLYKPGTLRIEVTRIIAEGDVVALEWHATGTSAKGNAYDNEYAFFFTLQDGQIASIREYCDTLHVQEALYS